MLLMTLLACAEDPCQGPGALSTCLEPTQDADYYAKWSSAYFDTMDYSVEGDPMPYSELVARWEWPPWLKLTAYTRENIEATDTLLTLYPSVVKERDCRGFDTQPFGRCVVTFYYDAHEGQPCPIYEEFVFNDAGEVTWIEAWSDVDGLRPWSEGEDWTEEPEIVRLSSRVPGLGNSEGRIDLDSEEMAAAVEADPDVADFVTRARDWQGTWLEELENTDQDEMWATGCGW